MDRWIYSRLFNSTTPPSNSQTHVFNEDHARKVAVLEEWRRQRKQKSSLLDGRVSYRVSCAFHAPTQATFSCSSSVWVISGGLQSVLQNGYSPPGPFFLLLEVVVAAFRKASSRAPKSRWSRLWRQGREHWLLRPPVLKPRRCWKGPVKMGTKRCSRRKGAVATLCGRGGCREGGNGCGTHTLIQDW